MPAFYDIKIYHPAKISLKYSYTQKVLQEVLILSKSLNKNLELSSSLTEAHFELKHLVSMTPFFSIVVTSSS